MRYLLLLSYFIVVTSFSTAVAQQRLQTPAEFLGYELGTRFTRHHRVIEYFNHVAAVTPHFKVQQYGETYEGRPLIIGIISAPENMNQLEALRKDNLKRVGILDGQPQDKKGIVWLSYNVHGNESCSMEAVMWTLHSLADPNNAQTREWLKNTVVILDPCINPDGRDRYANFYNQYGNKIPNNNIEAKEHHENWPGGRPNHYLFDLNRDWAWLTQKESRERVRLYNEWFPQVHVDFHEMGINSPYFFAPAAEPYHEVISSWQREMQQLIGRNNASYFDKEGWLYFTKEQYDLYYPSYGDTYPVYSGAVGMTYEQGGSGAAGLTVTTEEGDPLTLKDRLTHHYINGLSTIEVASKNNARMLTEFEKYFKDNLTTPPSKYKSFVIKPDNADKVARLTRWMDAHGIRYFKAGETRQTRGFDYQSRTLTNVTIGPEDLVVNVYQPKGRFVNVVFEPESKLNDSITYDITAWNLVYGYGLKGYALTEKISGKTWSKSETSGPALPAKPYAYLFKYQSLEDARFLAALLNSGVKVRFPYQPFTINGETFDRGTLIITRRNNESITNLDEYIRSEAQAHGRKVYATTTGFMDSGKDIGSSEVRYLHAPRVATLIGDQTYSQSVGQIWHFFEEELGFPITQIGTEYFRNADLDAYNTLIIPEGNYRILDDAMMDKVSRWVSDGGKLIVVGQALGNFVDRKGFGLSQYTDASEKDKFESLGKKIESSKMSLNFEANERYSTSDYITGAIYKVKLDTSHPLAYGLGSYYTLKSGEDRFGFLRNGWNVGTLSGSVKPVMGFAGFRANKRLENSLIFGVEEKGSGQVVYLADNPLFREFWESGKLLFANAVFLVGN